MPPFSAKVATTTVNREIYCIDAFAGAATYDDGSDGSPLLIAKFADECAGWKNPVHLRLINIEPDPKNKGIFSALNQATLEWQSRGTVTNIHDNFESALPNVLKAIDQAPALFFIDPFGPTYLHFEHLQPILTRTQQITELIINFDQDGLRRILDAALSKNIDIKAAETNKQNITRILGNENWKEKIANAGRLSEEVEMMLLREYMTNIAQYEYHVVGYPIRESLDTKPKYHFVYCTRHSDGIQLMNDFIREEEDLLYGEHIKDKLSLFPSEGLANEEGRTRQERLRDVMTKFVKEKKMLTRKQVIGQLVEQYFGQFHSRDYRAVFKEFIEMEIFTTRDLETKIDDRLYVVSSEL